MQKGADFSAKRTTYIEGLKAAAEGARDVGSA